MEEESPLRVPESQTSAVLFTRESPQNGAATAGAEEVAVGGMEFAEDDPPVRGCVVVEEEAPVMPWLEEERKAVTEDAVEAREEDEMRTPEHE